MRICYVSHVGSHFTAPYVEYFSKHGHEVHLISLQHGDVPHAIVHHPLRRRIDPEQAGPVYLWAHRPMRRLLREIQPDIVHAHYVTSNGFMAARCGWRPLVVSARGSDINQAIHHPIRRRLILYAMRRADLVNVVSRELERRVLDLGVPAAKVLRLTQGIDVSRFVVDRSTRREGPSRMICTRRLEPVYQCDRIIAALAVLAGRGLQFECDFAAAGPQRAELERLVADLGLGGRIRFLGGFRNEELPRMLAETDIYISASRTDGTSPALLEAMASGVFPVVSDIPANREWLRGDGDCLFFDPGSEQSLMKRLEQAIVDGSLRHGSVEPNRKRVQADADRDTNMKTLTEHYDRLAAQDVKLTP